MANTNVIIPDPRRNLFVENHVLAEGECRGAVIAVLSTVSLAIPPTVILDKYRTTGNCRDLTGLTKETNICVGWKIACQ